MTEFSVFVVVVLFVVLFVLGYLYAARYINQYEVGSRAIEIKLFGVAAVRRIQLQDIVEIQTISWTQTLPFAKGFRPAFLVAERWPSYIFSTRGVFIRKRSGISRFLVLSPQNPDEFVRKVLESQRTSPET